MLRKSLACVIAALAFSAVGFVQGGTAQADPIYPLNGCPNLTEGATGTCVQSLQYELDTYFGFSLQQDGQFGSLTEAAVVAFQQKAGIGVDGQAGSQTQAALYNDSQPAGGNCMAVMKLAPNYQGGALNDFGAALQLFVIDPGVGTGGCSGYVERSVNGGSWTRVSQVYTVPSNGGEEDSPAEWDGIGAKARVCVDSGGSTVCGGVF
jgi:peptidoglycan hydrolase-like protein with peptidoglycan-binding domain